VADTLIGGLYKDVDAANAGIPELQKQIASLQSERDTARNEVESLKKPKPPAFGDDKGLLEHFTKAKVDLPTISKKVIAEQKYEDADMEQIGNAIKEADPKWLGRTFAELHRHKTVTVIGESQQKVMKEIGGEDKLKKMIEWQDKHGKPEDKSQWAQEWHGTDENTRRAAAERLAGRFALNGSGTPKGASEGTTQPASVGAGKGFASRSEWITARNESRAKFGSQHFRTDTEFAKRYAETPHEIRSTFTS
jgi:hypothetical protein